MQVGNVLQHNGCSAEKVHVVFVAHEIGDVAHDEGVLGYSEFRPQARVG
jgi:hypothetical protein